ncbi:MAG: symmetrical bis(5'-nucleosyl)-tetraphosphatase [Candidatus Azosocius agrarius]|nr:MAG: symmetrical bis(5'-nucleosyl)-tetraphosphatase [Gammaproteobacteria bacterium]
MSTYVIGETYGCYKELQLLLEKINYNQKYDEILFTGNHINKKKNSLKLINYIKNMGKNTVSILGNNDITILSLANNKNIYNITGFDDILKSKKKIEILNWIQYLPLLHFNKLYNTIIVHAGLYPFWDVKKTINYAKKAEKLLQTSNYKIILKNINFNNVNIWNNKYNLIQKYQFIINTLTNMTICNNKGYLNINFKNTFKNIPHKFKPWFMINEKKFDKTNIIFGNWKELLGITHKKNITAMNMGISQGLYLSALNLKTKDKYYIKKL